MAAPRHDKPYYWTPDEVVQAELMLSGGAHLRDVSRAIGRGYEAVSHAFRRRGMGLRQMRTDVYTLADLEHIFGVRWEMLQRWIDAGELTLRPSRFKRRQRRPCYVTPEALTAFLAHRNAWPDWAPSLITDPVVREEAEHYRSLTLHRWLTIPELADRYCVSSRTIHDWVRIMQREGLAVQQRGRWWYVWSEDLDGWTPPTERPRRSPRRTI